MRWRNSLLVEGGGDRLSGLGYVVALVPLWKLLKVVLGFVGGVESGWFCKLLDRS